MPEREKLSTFASTGATLAVHLSIHVLEKLVEELVPHYGTDCAVAIVYRASWPDQQILRGTLATIAGLARENPMQRTALILVGPALAEDLAAGDDFRESALYSVGYRRQFRGGTRDG